MNDRQIKWDKRFLELAKYIATQWSKDPSTKCGSVIVEDINKIVTTGYNGFPIGVTDDESQYADRAIKYKKVVHAEANAILRAERSLKGCTVYVWPLPPCPECTKLMIQKRIARVVFPHYWNDSSIQDRWVEDYQYSKSMLLEAGVEIIQYYM